MIETAKENDPDALNRKDEEQTKAERLKDEINGFKHSFYNENGGGGNPPAPNLVAVSAGINSSRERKKSTS